MYIVYTIYVCIYIYIYICKINKFINFSAMLRGPWALPFLFPGSSGHAAHIAANPLTGVANSLMVSQIATNPLHRHHHSNPEP